MGGDWAPPWGWGGRCLSLVESGWGLDPVRRYGVSGPGCGGGLNAARTPGPGEEAHHALVARVRVGAGVLAVSVPVAIFHCGTDGSPRSARGDQLNHHFPVAPQRPRPASMRPALTPLQLLTFPVAAVPRSERRVHPQRRRPARLRHGDCASHCARARPAPGRRGCCRPRPTRTVKEAGLRGPRPDPASGFSGISYAA